MIYFLFFVYLCSTVLFVKSETNQYVSDAQLNHIARSQNTQHTAPPSAKLFNNSNLTIKIKYNQNCSAPPAYKFTDGDEINLMIDSNNIVINHGWIRNLNSSKPREEILSNFTSTRKLTVDKSKEGLWEFEFLYLWNEASIQEPWRKEYKGANYSKLICSTNVTIVPLPVDHTQKYWIIGSVVGVIAVVIILAQTACIVKLRAKAQALNRHEHLSKKTEPTANDSARYCSNPGQKMTKIVAPVDDNSRESAIYEAPNIELPDRAPILPPQPPAINTMPRTPRPDHNIRIGHQAMLAAAMKCPTQHPTFPGTKPSELNVANRPPLPLPPQNENYEVYEEMEPTEDNTYEPPPITNTMPHKPSVPQKKIVPAKVLDVQTDTLKLRTTGRKPPVTPKPKTPTQMPPFNELEMAFKRRNNVVQVPIKTIPSPSTSRGPSPKPKPAPIVNTRPKGPPVSAPVPQPIEEEIYINERRDSSDEEWTYEPLKPFNTYDTNIYNI